MSTHTTQDDFAALRMLPVALGVIDGAGCLTRVNDEARRMLRLRKDDTPCLQ